MSEWTENEDAVIEALYESGGAKACAPFLPGRGLPSIMSRASRLDVWYGKRPMSDNVDTPVPAHEYAEADYAVRNWRGPVSPAPLRWAA